GLSLLIGFSSQAVSKQLTYEDIENSLKSPDGLVAEIHGADHNTGLYILAVRNPENFFDTIQLPVIADYTSEGYVEVKEKLKTLNRHDFVRVHGKIHSQLHTAQKHAMIQSLELVKKFDGGYSDYPDYKHEVTLPADLINK